tara:strand:- start:438 stop:911 length:474 start_codon:yes stop_codon:yes gene_type:complete
MKTSILFLCLWFSTTALNQDPISNTVKKEFKELSWILGKWERSNVKAGSTAFEIWQKESEYVYTGLGVSLKGSDTTFVEKLRIEVKDNSIFYVADVRENVNPTYFKVNKVTSAGFTSENPEHDFPKMISYELEGKDLTAIISDGGEKKMGFFFKKVQ